MTSEGMLEDIAQGLPMAERKLALAVQGRSYGPMFDDWDRIWSDIVLFLV